MNVVQYSLVTSIRIFFFFFGTICVCRSAMVHMSSILVRQQRNHVSSNGLHSISYCFESFFFLSRITVSWAASKCTLTMTIKFRQEKKPHTHNVTCRRGLVNYVYRWPFAHQGIVIEFLVCSSIDYNTTMNTIQKHFVKCALKLFEYGETFVTRT